MSTYKIEIAVWTPDDYFGVFDKIEDVILPLHEDGKFEIQLMIGHPIDEDHGILD